jgi:hypothetical protein
VLNADRSCQFTEFPLHSDYQQNESFPCGEHRPGAQESAAFVFMPLIGWIEQKTLHFERSGDFTIEIHIVL